jgi:GMP synthase-like glutamine amidotransferase
VAPTVLFVRNESIAAEAMLGEAFADAGYDVATLDVARPGLGKDPDADVTFPEPTRYDVLVPLGASWAVYDEALRDRWVGAEMQWLRDADAAGVASLGVCFGGQLIAQAFGGTVQRAEVPEVGWHEVTSSDESVIPAGRWFQWHFDRWTALPPGATELARTANASQAFLVGKALALQFHPELDEALLESWIVADDSKDLTAVGLTADELRAATVELRPDAQKRIHRLVAGFVERVVRQPCPS